VATSPTGMGAVQLDNWKPNPSEGGEFEQPDLASYEKWIVKETQKDARSWLSSLWKWLLPLFLAATIWDDRKIQQLNQHSETLPINPDKFARVVEIAVKVGAGQAFQDVTQEEKEKPPSQKPPSPRKPSPPRKPPGRLAHAQWIARTTAATKMREWATGMREDVRWQVVEAIREGLTAKQLAQRLEERWEKTGANYQLIATTELSMAYNSGYLLSLPEHCYVTVPAIGDERVCPACKELLENKVFEVLHNQPINPTRFEWETCVWPNKSNFGRKAKDYVPCVPLHPNCRHKYQFFSGVPANIRTKRR